LTYTCNPRASIGRRIGDLRVNSGPIEADKFYRVAGWASVAESASASTPMWETLETHLRSAGRVRRVRINTPKLV
jgi:sulfur-oxidizing protein SoxB